jgi:hypothetical protein
MAKRLKINDSLKWYPILSNEYFNKNFTFKTYMKASIEDNKKISFLVEKLQQLYPLNDSKFKRVKKLDQESNEKINKFEILLTFEDFLEFKQLMLNYKSVIILFILKMILLNFQTFQTFLYIIGKFALILEKNSNLFMF